MIFDWSAYLTLAEDLSRQTDEAAQRSAVSRAYYCAYNKALIYARSQNWWIKPGGSLHRNLWEAFRSHQDPYAPLYQLGMRLRDRRNDADYESEIEIEGLARLALDDAHEILRHLAKF